MEVNFLFGQKDRDDFLSWCLKKEYTLVPNLTYTNNKPIYIKTIYDYHGLSLLPDSFAILHKDFDWKLLEMNEIKSPNGITYKIKQRMGGPFIDFYAPITQANHVSAGIMSIFPYYYNGLEKIHPNRNFLKAFNHFTYYIHKRSIKTKQGKKIIWIGKQTLLDYNEGLIRIQGIDSIQILDLLHQIKT